MTQTHLYIVGAGGHSKVVRDAVDPKEFPTVSFLVQDKYIAEIQQQAHQSQISSFEKAIDRDTRNFICAIGDISARQNLYDLAVRHSWNARTIYHHTTTISKSAIVGDGSYLGANTTINPDSIIGNNCVINTGATIEHDCIILDHVNISPSATICGKVKIGCNVLIGAGATILQVLK